MTNMRGRQKESLADEMPRRGGFGRYKQRISAIKTWKMHTGRHNVINYVDLGEEAEDHE